MRNVCFMVSGLKNAPLKINEGVEAFFKIVHKGNFFKAYYDHKGEVNKMAQDIFQAFKQVIDRVHIVENGKAFINKAFAYIHHKNSTP